MEREQRINDLSEVIYYSLGDDCLHIGNICYPIRTVEERQFALKKLEIISWVAPAVAGIAALTLQTAHEMLNGLDVARDIIKRSGGL